MHQYIIITIIDKAIRPDCIVPAHTLHTTKITHSHTYISRLVEQLYILKKAREDKKLLAQHCVITILFTAALQLTRRAELSVLPYFCTDKCE